MEEGRGSVRTAGGQRSPAMSPLRNNNCPRARGSSRVPRTYRAGASQSPPAYETLRARTRPTCEQRHGAQQGLRVVVSSPKAQALQSRCSTDTSPAARQPPLPPRPTAAAVGSQNAGCATPANPFHTVLWPHCRSRTLGISSPAMPIACSASHLNQQLRDPPTSDCAARQLPNLRAGTSLR
eukprot:scaffold1041_cov124-Isochrysis_galbana.AAC.11